MSLFHTLCLSSLQHLALLEQGDKETVRLLPFEQQISQEVLSQAVVRRLLKFSPSLL